MSLQTKHILFLAATILVVGIVCVCVTGYIVLRSFDPFAATSQPDNGDGTFGPQPAHECSTTIDGYKFSIELNLIHPFLAEYEKIVTISTADGTVLATEKFIDTGGFAAFYFFRDEQSITIVDGFGEGVSLLKHDNTTSRGQFSYSLDRIDSDSIGRTMFCPNGYRYLDASKVAAQNSTINDE